jgi:hypothetical protein
MEPVIGKLIPSDSVPKALSVPAAIYLVSESMPICEVISYTRIIISGKSKNGRSAACIPLEINHYLSEHELKKEEEYTDFKNWILFPYIDNLTERKKVTLPVYCSNKEFTQISKKSIHRDFFDSRHDCVIGKLLSYY